MKSGKKLLWIVLVTMGLTSCTFDLSSNDNTIELPNTYGINVEAVFQTPQFILDHQITWNEISISYTVRKNDAFVANVKLYVSSDQSADNLENGTDEDVINVSLGASETQKSGVVTSPLLTQILNNKQPYFVIGGQNLSLSPISSVFIDLDVKFKGSYK